MSIAIKAIETVYNGYRFRSRLEARWAVFFDGLGVKYEYEKEGYPLSVVRFGELTRFRYLPDFWLPVQKRWIEIKGQEPTEEERTKADALHRSTGFPVCLFWGLPGENGGLAYYSCSHEDNSGSFFEADVRWRSCPGCGINDVDIRHGDDCSIINEQDDWKHLDSCDCSYQDIEDYYNTPDIIAAYTAARQARFEHGERG